MGCRQFRPPTTHIATRVKAMSRTPRIANFTWTDAAKNASEFLLYAAIAILTYRETNDELVAALLTVAAFTIYRFPKWYVAKLPNNDNLDTRLEREDEARRTILQILGASAILAGVYFTYQSAKPTLENLETQTRAIRQELDTTRYREYETSIANAITLLNSPNEESATAGLFILDRLAHNSPSRQQLKPVQAQQDRRQIIEIISAYIRRHASLPRSTASSNPDDLIRNYKQIRIKEGRIIRPYSEVLRLAFNTIAKVKVGLCSRSNPIRLRYLDLTALDLSGLDLAYCDFSGSIAVDLVMHQTQLNGSRLNSCTFVALRSHELDLRGAFVMRAIFNDKCELHYARFSPDEAQYPTLIRGSKFHNCSLRHAAMKAVEAQESSFQESDLSFAQAPGGKFFGADFSQTICQGTNFSNADLRTYNLGHMATLNKAKLYGATLTPACLREPCTPITQQLLSQACVNPQTTIPENLRRPPPCPD